MVAKFGADQGALRLRVLTAIVLVVVALAAVSLGGSAFTALVAAAVLVMLAEWAVMHRLERLVRLVGLAIVGGTVVLASQGWFVEAALLLAFGSVTIGFLAATLGLEPAIHGRSARRLDIGKARDAVTGVLYCGLPALALVWLRGLPLGFAATVFLLVCVWAADIAAYFTGRALGGAKLAPSISPNKTWSGAVGGVVGAVVLAGGLAIAYLARVDGQGAWKFLMLAAGLAMLSVLGDLYESWLKRRAGVKDSGSLLPGHGGLMDRLDGLVPVAVVGAGVFAITGWAG